MLAPLLSLATLLSAPARAPQGPELPFEELGRAVLAAADERGAVARGFDGTVELDLQLLRRLEPLHARVDLGGLELWVPLEVLDARGRGEAGPAPRAVRTYARDLAALQRLWVEQAGLGAGRREELAAALAVLDAWVADLAGRKWSAPPDAVVAARATVRDALLGGVRAADEALLPREFGLVLVLCPTRAHYLGAIGAAGILLPTWRDAIWVAEQRASLAAQLAPETTAAALSWGPHDPASSPLTDGGSDGAVVRHQLVHSASHLLSARLLPDVPLWFSEGLAVVDTVRVCGGDGTLCSGFRAQIDWDPYLVGPAAMLRWVFRDVSPFRNGADAGFFVSALAAAHDDGRLRLIDFDTGKPSLAVEPPLLGPDARTPDAVTSGPVGLKRSYAELYRAYAAAFVHHLDAAPAGGGRSLLARTLTTLAAMPPSERFRGRDHVGKVLLTLTGKTIGRSADPARDLEAGFLPWLLQRGR